MTTPDSSVLNAGGVVQPSLDGSVEALLQNAQRLGLQWRMIPGTVEQGASPAACTVTVDGDVAVTRAESLIGAIGSGVRVMCLWVFPNSLYVIGFRQAGPPASLSAKFIVSSPTNVTSGGAGITVPWETERDPFGIGNAAGVLTMPSGYDGLWDVDVQILWSATASVAGFRLLSAAVNSTTMLEDRRTANNTGGNLTSNALNQPLELVAGNTLSHGVFQNSGGTLTIGSASDNQLRARLTMQYRGPLLT